MCVSVVSEADKTNGNVNMAKNTSDDHLPFYLVHMSKTVLWLMVLVILFYFVFLLHSLENCNLAASVPKMIP